MLLLFRKIRRAAVKQLTQIDSGNRRNVESGLALLFGDSNPALEALQEAIDNDCI
jgi:hypothetical protein